MEACGDNPNIGYTTDHAPEASIPLDEQFDAALIDGDDVDIIASTSSVNCSLYLGEWTFWQPGPDLAWRVLLACFFVCVSLCVSCCRPRVLAVSSCVICLACLFRILQSQGLCVLMVSIWEQRSSRGVSQSDELLVFDAFDPLPTRLNNQGRRTMSDQARLLPPVCLSLFSPATRVTL